MILNLVGVGLVVGSVMGLEWAPPLLALYMGLVALYKLYLISSIMLALASMEGWTERIEEADLRDLWASLIVWWAAFVALFSAGLDLFAMGVVFWLLIETSVAVFMSMYKMGWIDITKE